MIPRILTFALGIWLFLAPAALRYPAIDDAARHNSFWAGIVITLSALLSLLEVRTIFLALAVGVWVAFAPMIFEHASMAAIVNDVLVGSLVALAAVAVRYPIIRRSRGVAPGMQARIRR